MKKKAYVSPATDVVALMSTIQLLAGSGELQASGETNDPDDLLSRELKPRSIWDDDEE